MIAMAILRATIPKVFTTVPANQDFMETERTFATVNE